MFVSDLVTTGRLPEDVLRNADKLWADWLAVASDRREYLNAIKAAGFPTIAVVAEGPFPLSEADNVLKGRIISIQVKGTKQEGRMWSESMDAPGRDTQNRKNKGITRGSRRRGKPRA